VKTIRKIERKDVMESLYIIGSLLAALLLAYLFVALLWPEVF